MLLNIYRLPFTEQQLKNSRLIKVRQLKNCTIIKLNCAPLQANQMPASLHWHGMANGNIII